MKRIFIIATISLLTIFSISIFVPDTAYARPGGGHSYSNDSGSSGSDSDDYGDSDYSSGGGGGNPWIVLPLVITMFILVIYGPKFLSKRRENLGITSTRIISIKKLDKVKSEIKKLKKADPNFSETLFLDFVALLFHRHYSWLFSPEYNKLSVFMPQELIDASENAKIESKLSEIVIGAIYISEIKEFEGKQTILLEIQANFTQTINGKRTRFGLTDRWRFFRFVGVQSLEPEKMRELSCLNCGASLSFNKSGKCESCNTAVENGEKQWAVDILNRLTTPVFKTSGLIHYALEKGTKYRTVFQSDLESSKSIFAKNHNLNWDEWQTKFNTQIATEYFFNIYDAWTMNKLEIVRNLLSDNIFVSWSFWIDNYKKEGLNNKLDNVSIKKVEFVKVDIDKFYESATVRIHASCFDYVENKDGKLEGGSKEKLREFSEYWTFIRRTGVEKDSYDYGTCPNCGAIADKMGQSGICEYCNTKISNGDFSWVVAVVTQDEVYKG